MLDRAEGFCWFFSPLEPHSQKQTSMFKLKTRGTKGFNSEKESCIGVGVLWGSCVFFQKTFEKRDTHTPQLLKLLLFTLRISGLQQNLKFRFWKKKSFFENYVGRVYNEFECTEQIHICSTKLDFHMIYLVHLLPFSTFILDLSIVIPKGKQYNRFIRGHYLLILFIVFIMVELSNSWTDYWVLASD